MSGRADKLSGAPTAYGCGPRRRRLRLVTTAAATLAAVLLFAPVVAGARATAAWSSQARPLAGLDVVRQRELNDCGPAVIATLLAWAGRDVPLDVIAHATFMGPQGVTLAEFARSAADHGIAGAWYHVPPSRLESLKAPFVAHLVRGDVGHFVAVLGLGGGYAVIADPARGAVVGTARELLQAYSGRSFLLDNPRGLHPGGGKS